MQKLMLFQHTVKEYKRFTEQLPINYYEAKHGDFSEFTYVAAQTRLMLLRKYTREGRGNLHIVELITKALDLFPKHQHYLDDFQNRFIQACEGSLIHALADGSQRTLGESIDDTMYGIHLHADPNRVKRISQDNELLRLYCVIVFVEQIELLVLEMFDFLERNGISNLNEQKHRYAPVIQLENNITKNSKNLKDSFWNNLNAVDMTEDNISDVFRNYSLEDWEVFNAAVSFTSLLAQEPFSYDKMEDIVLATNISDWGDFSEAIEYYKRIPSPGTSSRIEYVNDKRVAYVNILPGVKKGFIVNSHQLISDVSVITLIKDDCSNKWKIFAFGGKGLAPFINA